MGEPEAGSEFANRAAAAGEELRLGFGVTVCRPPGTRARLDREQDHSLFAHLSVTPSKSIPVPRPRKVPGSKELTPLSEPAGCAIGAEPREWVGGG